ncbi:MAG: hypothetical protein ACFCD0_02935 [Gemmataceae bacterium]
MRLTITCACLLATLLGLAPDFAWSADTIVDVQIPLKTPRRKKPRMGGPLDKVELRIWIPNGVQKVRGVIVNPYYLKAVGQRHWQAAARQWNFGIVAANYFGVKNNEFGPTLLTAMKVFGEKANHPELADAYFCFVGMSAGGGMSTRFAEALPERTIAVAPVCLEVGPRSEAARKIPHLTIFGERDGRQMEKLNKRLPEQRMLGALYATAVQWRKRHEFALANNLIFPYFDHVIRARLSRPKKKLAGMSLEQGWLGDRTTWETNFPQVRPWKEYKSDKDSACWLPDAYVASVWRAFVSKAPSIKVASPPGLGGGQELVFHAPGKDIAVKLTLRGKKPVKQVTLFDGNKEIAKAVTLPTTVTVRFGPGIHALIAEVTYADGQQEVSRPSTILVKANTSAGQ